MEHEQAERLYQSAEESFRASLDAWGKAFDAAQAGGDIAFWDMEEAAWRANRQISSVRAQAWELCDQLLSESRERIRRAALTPPPQPLRPAPNGAPWPSLAHELEAKRAEAERTV